MSGKLKLTIKLTKDQMGEYPVSTESLWFDLEGNYFKLKNVPFFIDNLSFDDVISVILIEDNLYKIEKIIFKSKNSTIWLCVGNEEKGKLVLSDINKLGCTIEGGVLEGYFAINVPENLDIGNLYSLIDSAEKDEILVADYPSIRHPE